MIDRLVHRVAGPEGIRSAGARSRIGVLSGIMGILCNLVLVVLKLTVGYVSGSVAIVADGINNLGDIGSSFITLWGFRMAGKPADPEHPFGHGRAEYMGGFVVALIICLMGFEVLQSAFAQIGAAVDLAIDRYVITALVFSIAVKLFMVAYNRGFAKAIGSAALRGTALDSLTDVAATSSVLLSALLYRYGGIAIDAYVGMGVAAFILYTGLRTAKEIGDLLLGQYTDPELVRAIEAQVLAFDARILGLHDLMVHSYGPSHRYAYLDLELPSSLGAQAAHALVDACEREVGEALGVALRIHTDPVDVEDRLLLELQGALNALLPGVEPGAHFHDLRFLGEGRTDIAFDLVLPHGQKRREDDIVRAVLDTLAPLYGGLRFHIAVDADFSQP